MTQDYAASVTGSHIRITRLTSSGSLLVGPSASYVTKQFVSLSITPEYEDGDEFSQKSASGTVCVSFKTADTLKRVTLQVALCNPDPEFTEMASGGKLLSKAGKSIGWAAPAIGVDALPNGIAVEVWSKAISGGKQSGTDPYWHWLVPYATLRSSGDITIENGITATAFEGWGVGNAGFGSGPAAPAWPFDSESAYAYTRTDSVPVGTGYQAVTVTP